MNTVLNCINPDEADAILFCVEYDKTSSYKKGSVNGPKAILESLKNQIEFFDRYSKTEPGLNFKFSYYNPDNLNHLESEEMINKVYKEYLSFLEKNKFLVLLGGEHSVSIGAFKALSQKHNPKEVTIVQIDAHHDLRDNDENANQNNPIPNSFAHSCVARRAHEMGYKLIQIGIRVSDKDEYEYHQRNQDTIKVFNWDIEKIPTIKKILSSIKTDKVYLDIDVDGIDPAHMPATGTPVQGGLEWYYTINLIRSIIEKKNVIGADIVEVSPRPDDVLTEYGAAQMVYNIISQQTIKTQKI